MAQHDCCHRDGKRSANGMVISRMSDFACVTTARSNTDSYCSKLACVASSRLASDELKNFSASPRKVRSRGVNGSSPQRAQNGVVTATLQVGQVQGAAPSPRWRRLDRSGLRKVPGE